jgi:hypothetical protein
MDSLFNFENSIGNHRSFQLKTNNLESALDVRLRLGHQGSLPLKQNILAMRLVRLPNKLFA